MLSIGLNIIGFILVLYSIYIIRKDLLIKQDSQNDFLEFKNIDKEFYEPVEDEIEDFNNLIDMKIREKNVEENYKEIELKQNIINKNVDLIIKEKSLNKKEINPLHKKIIELKSIGLTNEDIAKNLGRGIREIDIVLKIYKK